MVINKASVNR